MVLAPMRIVSLKVDHDDRDLLKNEPPQSSEEVEEGMNFMQSAVFLIYIE